MHPSRRPIRITPAQAREAYAHAKAHLLAAEEAYARALLVLRQAQAHSQAALPLPGHQRHFLCGHEQMERTMEEEDGQALSLCPVCRITQEAAPAFFTEQRTLLIRMSRPNDPA